MSIDRYTKAVLTVIAGCLLWICAMGLGPSLSAQPVMGAIPNGNVQPVIIVGTGTLDQKGNIAVSYVRQAEGPPRTEPAIPVTLPYTPTRPLPVGLSYNASNPMPAQLFYTGAAPLPVEITGVKKVGEWEPLRARIEDAPAKARPGGGER